MDQTVHQMLHELSIADLWAISKYFKPENKEEVEFIKMVYKEIETRIDAIKSKM